jgi:hypothetical protein
MAARCLSTTSPTSPRTARLVRVRSCTRARATHAARRRGLVRSRPRLHAVSRGRLLSGRVRGARAPARARMRLTAGLTAGRARAQVPHLGAAGLLESDRVRRDARGMSAGAALPRRPLLGVRHGLHRPVLRGVRGELLRAGGGLRAVQRPRACGDADPVAGRLQPAARALAHLCERQRVVARRLYADGLSVRLGCVHMPAAPGDSLACTLRVRAGCCGRRASAARTRCRPSCTRCCRFSRSPRATCRSFSRAARASARSRRCSS